MMIKLLSNKPLSPKLPPLFNQRILPNHLSWQSPTPHIHWEIVIFMPSPPPPKQIEKTKITIDGKVTFHYPLSPTIFTLFTQRLTPDILPRQYPTPHIHWEIAVFIPPPPPRKEHKKPKITIDDKVTFRYPPLPKLQLTLPTMLSPNPLDIHSPTPHTHLETAINISTSHPTPKKWGKKHENWW